MTTEITGQSGAGMVHMHLYHPEPMEQDQALAVLPPGSSIHYAGLAGWVTVVLNVPSRVARAFEDYTYPRFVPGWDRFPNFSMRADSLGAFVRQWKNFA